MSASRFDSYMTCPYMFYNQYILNTISKEDSNNKYNVIGNLLHKIFDKWSQIRPLNEELIALEYTNAFDSIDRKLFDDDYEFNTLKTLHTTTLSNWIRHEETMQVPRTSEQEIEFNIDGIDVPIKAILDRIEDNYDLLDYKTGKVYSSDKLENNLQMAIYALAIKHKYGVLPKKITLYFPQFDAERVFENIIGDTYVCNVKRGGTYSFTLTDRINTMQSIYTKMKKGIYPLSTQNSYFCSKFCAVGLTKQCDAVNL
jgi:RecB family exonuclease